MTSYQGGKGRIGKRIYRVLSLIEEDLSNEILPYFEPFLGMAGVMRHFAAEHRELYACDYNADLIAMWKAVQRGWKPPLKCSKKRYDELKNYTGRPNPERAFIGIVASYGCVLFNGYRLHYNKDKDYLREGYNGIMKIQNVMNNVDIMDACSYTEFTPVGYLIYCDPPYIHNQLKSKYFEKFDHETFWQRMREWSKNNIVVVSESTAPKDFSKIWCVGSNCSTRYNNKQYQDCLYMHRDSAQKLSRSAKRKIREIK